MKPNKAFLFAILFFGVGNEAVELGARMALHCDFRGRERQTAPMAVKILKGIKSIDIPFQLPLSRRLTVSSKTARQL